MIKHLFLLFSVFIGLKSEAQSINDINFEHYSPDMGLSQGSGYASAQFDDFMWFGTQDGLNRFDGYDFKVYKSGQLIGNYTQTLLNDQRGRLWVGTGRGLNIYDPRRDSFQEFEQYYGAKHILQHASTRHLLMDKQKNIWILTDENGAFYFNFEGKTITAYPEFSNRLIDITEANDGSVYVATDDDIYQLDPDRKKFAPLNLKNILGSVQKVTFRSVLADKQNNVWVGTYENGLYMLMPGDSQLILKQHFMEGEAPSHLSSNEITRMMQDSKGKIWVGTRTGGISIYDPESRQFQHVTNKENDPSSLTVNYVLSFSEDRQKNIWVGLSGRGFEKFDPLKYQFNVLRKDEKGPGKSLPDNMIFKIFGFKKHLYIGTQSGGLARYNPVQKGAKTYKNEPGNPASLPHNEVYDISADKSGSLWLALGKGLCKLDPESEKFQSYPKAGQEGLVYLYTVKALGNGEIWTGGQRGLFRFDPGQNKWLDWDDLPALKAISKYVIRLLFEDSAGNIWLGTTGHGLIKYSPVTKLITRYQVYNGVDCPNIRSVFEDEKSFWFGTDCGAFELDKKRNIIFTHLTDENDLPNNVVYAITKDKKGEIWLSTNKGLTVYNPSSKKFKNYNASDGLQANEFNTNCYFNAGDGTMYFGGVNGISYFKPESLNFNTYTGPVRITNIKVMEQVYRDSLSLSYVSRLDLPYNRNFISFEFSMFNFSNSERNSYKYRMEGLEESWVKAGNAHRANYTNLPPGRYLFQVRGTNNDGVENPKPAVIEVNIHPPFWQTFWFRTLLVLLVIGFVYLIYRNKIASIRGEERQKAEIKRIRTEAETALLRAQISPDFVLNSLNAVEAYTLTNRRREASRFLQIFSKLIRLVLDNSRHELVPFSDDLQALKLFVQLEEERYVQSFKTTFDVDPSLNEIFYQVPPLVIQPFIETAITNGFATLEANDDVLTISMKGQGTGLAVLIRSQSLSPETSASNQELVTQPLSSNTSIAKKRIEALGNLYEMSTSCEIQTLESGLQIELLIPLIDSRE